MNRTILVTSLVFTSFVVLNAHAGPTRGRPATEVKTESKGLGKTDINEGLIRPIEQAVPDESLPLVLSSIRADLGYNGPGYVQRNFVRAHHTIVGLNYEVLGTNERRLTITVPGIAVSKSKFFYNEMKKEIQSAFPDAELQVSATSGEPGGLVPEAYQVSTGLRNPLTAEEGAKLFDAVNAALTRVLKNTWKETQISPGLLKQELEETF